MGGQNGTPIFNSNVNWATAYPKHANIWNPKFLADLKGFSVFRHMDTNAVNWSQIKCWSERTLPRDPQNASVYIDSSSAPSTAGLALEWQIDLCNRANVDCWFTHPYLADNNYIRQQAKLIKRKLKPGLRVYIELSNEVWNDSYAAYHQAIAEGLANGLPGDDRWAKGIAHEMYRALEMYQIYQEVFGASKMGKRVIRVFSESGDLDLTTQALENVYKSSKWNRRHQKIDMMAVAPYIGVGVDGSYENFARWKGEVDQRVGGDPVTVALAQNKTFGIPRLGCYEAGMGHSKHANVWSSNPEIYDAYTYMLDSFATKMNGPCALYTLHGKWEATGAWGLYSAVGQPLTASPKARAVKDWISAH